MPQLDVDTMWNEFLEMPYVERLPKEQLVVSRHTFDHMEHALGDLLDKDMSVPHFFGAKVRIAQFLASPTFTGTLRQQMKAAGKFDAAAVDAHVASHVASNTHDAAIFEQQRLLAETGVPRDVDGLVNGVKALRELRDAGKQLDRMTVAEFVQQHWKELL